MPKVIIDKNECKSCEYCVTDCPKGVIGMGSEVNGMGYFPAEVKHAERCNGCGICFIMCPHVAITVEK